MTRPWDNVECETVAYGAWDSGTRTIYKTAIPLWKGGGMARQPKEPWEVVTSYTLPDGSTGYARLWHRDKGEWCKRVAMRYAREYKANHLRDAWVQPVE